MPVVNEAIRSLYAPVRDALRRHQSNRRSSVTGGSACSTSIAKPLVTAADDAGDWYEGR